MLTMNTMIPMIKRLRASIFFALSASFMPNTKPTMPNARAVEDIRPARIDHVRLSHANLIYNNEKHTNIIIAMSYTSLNTLRTLSSTAPDVTLPQAAVSTSTVLFLQSTSALISSTPKTLSSSATTERLMRNLQTPHSQRNLKSTRMQLSPDFTELCPTAL